MVSLACWIVCGSKAMGVPVIVMCGHWSLLGALLLFLSLLGGHSCLLGTRLLGTGCCLLIIVLFASGYQLVRQLTLFWVAGLDVGCMTWHAGDIEGTHVVVDVGDVGMWLSVFFC